MACNTAVSLLTCDLGLVLELTGGFSATCLAFIFRKSLFRLVVCSQVVDISLRRPAAACSLHLSSEPFARSKWSTWACMGFGIVVCVSLNTLLPRSTCLTQSTFTALGDFAVNYQVWVKASQSLLATGSIVRPAFTAITSLCPDDSHSLNDLCYKLGWILATSRLQ